MPDNLQDAAVDPGFEYHPEATLVVERDTEALLAANRAARQRYGWGERGFQGLHVVDLDAEPGLPLPAPGEAAFRRHRRAGLPVEVEICCEPVRWGAWDAWLVEVRDAARIRSLERELEQAQKLESIGRLAAGLAHDFNNLLGVMNGYGSLLLGSLHEGDPRCRWARELLRAGERASGLSRQILELGRRRSTASRVVDVNLLVAELRQMLERVLGEDVAIEARLSPDLGRVRLEPGRLEQVLLNLATNARDAMPDGGRLTLCTSNLDLQEAEPRPGGLLRPGRYVRLSVGDTGPGIPPEVAARIFEPFFTTKPPGRGTGLGLATVQQVVRDAGGGLRLRTGPGGTWFDVDLPRVDAPGESLAPAVPDPATATSGGGGGELVLVVEDDVALRGCLAEALEEAGYAVLAASSAEVALEATRLHRGRVDVLCTDLVLPGLGGAELVERLRESNPGLPVVFLSGYPSGAGAPAGSTVLAKPVPLATLLRHVREAVGARPRQALPVS